MNRVRWIWCVFVLLAGTVRSVGQEPVDPKLILNTGGPSAQVRALAFSSDSTRLYAAGLDKVVHVWEVGWNGKDDGSTAVTYTRPLHWEIARGNRGSILSLQLSPTRPEMVIAGVSARLQTGDIAAFDLATGTISTALPSSQQRQTAVDQPRFGSEGHQHTVAALDFAPSGDAILSRDEYGGMFLWRRTAQDAFQSERLRAPASQASRFPPLGMFLDEQTIVYSSPEAGDNVSLLRRDLKTGREVRFPETYARRVAALARDRTGNFWASADDQRRVYLTSLKNPQQRHTLTSTLPEITAIAFGGQNLMAVVSNQFVDGRLRRDGRAVVDLFDTSLRKRIDSVDVSATENTLAAAISPDGKYLATHREDPRQILVYRLTDPNGNRAQQPLSRQPPVVAQANSAPVKELRLSPDGTRLALDSSSRRGSEPVLDLRTGEVVADNTEKTNWKTAVTEPPDWKVVIADSRTDLISLTDPLGRHWNIRLDPVFQGTYFSHCFLFAADGSREPVGIAVGTENGNSIFVYRFQRDADSTDADDSPKLVRWFRDHTGPILAMVPSRDGSTLFSASSDHTVKLWRIAELLEPAAAAPPSGFKQQSFWGCDFVIENGRVIVRRVDENGIAFARSLRDGDRITRVQGRNDRRDPNLILDAQAPKQTAVQILQTLDRMLVLDQVLIHAESAEVANPIQKAFFIRPAWEPIVTVFVNRAGEWAIWHPKGYFNASAAEGGGLFQWLINRGSDVSPRVLEGGFLAKQFERPEVIQKLLSGVSLRQSLAGIDTPGSERFAETISQIPEVNLISPPTGEVIAADAPLNVLASVSFGEANPEDYRVIASIDGVRLGAGTRRAVVGDRHEFTWTARPTGKLNQIEVIATQRGGALDSLYASTVAYRRGQTLNPTPYQLHLLSLASENYQGKLATQRGGFGPLQYSIDDVDAIAKTLRDKQDAGLGKYRIGQVRELRDDEITPQTVRQAIDSLNATMASATGPQLLVIYLSGHGTTVDGQYHYVTTTTSSADAADMKRSALPWTLLNDAGSANCRVIYMIDTCHSGSAVDAKSSIRDPLRGGGIVVAAASGREAAKELAPLGHGCFTYSVLAALNGEADGVMASGAVVKSASRAGRAAPADDDSTAADGIVDLEELVNFTRDYVQRLTAGEQRPSATPSRLTSTLKIPLVATPHEERH